MRANKKDIEPSLKAGLNFLCCKPKINKTPFKIKESYLFYKFNAQRFYSRRGLSPYK